LDQPKVSENLLLAFQLRDLRSSLDQSNVFGNIKLSKRFCKLLY